MNEINVVTGAFSHTGKSVARLLHSKGREIRTLTSRSAIDNPFDFKVEAFPFNFENPNELRKSLEGANILYNTYWIRFPYKEMTFEKAIENSKRLIESAKEAGIKRIVHLSITNPSEKSPFPYFRGKAEVERMILESKLSYAIIRPSVIFSQEAILINTIAWLLRNFPIFAIPGSGNYLLRPVFVEDLARMMVEAGDQKEDITINAVGPGVFSFERIVRLIAKKIGSQAKFIHLRPEIALIFARCIGYLVKDVLITKDEIKGLMADLLFAEPSNKLKAKTAFSEWLEKNAENLGRRYLAELKRHYR